MTALLALYGLVALAAHVEAPPETSPTHDVHDDQEETDALTDTRTLEDGGDRAPVGRREGPEPSSIPGHWLKLADCESGEWIDGGFVDGSARWGYGKPGGFTHEGYEQYEGGLNFHPDTWTWVAGDLGLLDTYPHAYDAPAHVQVEAGAEVQARQGWAAWPICSRKVGLR